MDAQKKDYLNKCFPFCQDVQFRIIETQLMKSVGDGSLEDFKEICHKFLDFYQGCEVHPGKDILYQDRMIRIDQDLVDLIKLIWENGIVTIDSCQGNNHNCDNNDAYIVFRTKADFEKFSKLVDHQFKSSDYEYDNRGFDITYDQPIQIYFPPDQIPQISQQLSK